VKKNRTELTAEQVATRSAAVVSKIKLDFEKKDVSYVSDEDLKYVVGRKRDRDSVRQEFADKMLKDFNAGTGEAAGGRTAVFKR
jgi:hypothetical protein